MTGWRCGYAAVPERAGRAAHALPRQLDLVRAAVRAARRASPRSTGPAGRASTRCVAEFRARRDLVVAGLNALPGRHVPRCRAARSTRSRTSPAVPLGADALADRLLDEAGVAVLTGTAFGAQGEGHLRLSYANSQANLSRALERMGAFLGGALAFEAGRVVGAYRSPAPPIQRREGDQRGPRAPTPVRISRERAGPVAAGARASASR